MKKLAILVAAGAMVGFAGSAIANDHEPAGNANGVYGCSSGGATAKNPGQWFRALKQIAVLEGLNPAEMADKENTTEGWAGYEQTPNVGAFIDFFCGNPD